MDLSLALWPLLVAVTMGNGRVVAAAPLGRAATPAVPCFDCKAASMTLRPGALPNAGEGEDVEVARLLSTPLTAVAAARVAILNNRGMRAQIQRLAQAAARARQAGLPANPQIDVESLPERDTQLELRLGYNVTSLLFAHLDQTAAAADADVNALQVMQQAIQLQYAAQVALYDLVAANQQAATAQVATQTFAAGREAAHALYEAGNIPFTDLGLQIAAHERSRVLLVRFELAVVRQRERFARLLGLRDSTQPWTVVGKLVLPGDDHGDIEPGALEDAAVAASLELQEARQRLEAVARKRKATTTRGWVPDVTVDVHSLYGRPQGSLTAAHERPWTFGAGVTVSLPFIDRRQGTTEVYGAKMVALKSDAHAIETDTRSTAREIKAVMQAAIAQVKAYETAVLPAQANVTRQSILQYNAMQIGVLPLLQAKREELDQQLAYVSALRDLAQAHAARLALLSGVRPQPVPTPGTDAGDMSLPAMPGGSNE